MCKVKRNMEFIFVRSIDEGKVGKNNIYLRLVLKYYLFLKCRFGEGEKI